MSLAHHDDLPLALSLSSELITHLHNLNTSTLQYRAAVIDRQPIPTPLIPFSLQPPPSSCYETGFFSAEGKIGEGERSGRGKAKTRVEWVQGDIVGWNKFVQSLERQHAALQHVSTRQPTSADLRDSPLPPILSSLTMYKTLLSAATPITAVKARFGASGSEGEGWCQAETKRNVCGKRVGVGFVRDREEGYGKGKSKGKEVEAVVDVVCKGGADWIKLYTKKEAQLMAEFREQDSYATSDWSDSDDDPLSRNDPIQSRAASTSKDPSLSDEKPELPFTNSLIDTAHSLLALAQITPRPPGAAAPSITIRLTRLPNDQSSSDLDPRIPQTYDYLRLSGVKLQFGDLDDIPLASLPRAKVPVTELLPSLKVNLDPTALVGLCCDALHHPIPRDMAEARKRYFRPRRYLHDNGSGEATPMPDMASLAIDAGSEPEEAWLDGYDDHRQSQHSRELFKEALEESRSPLIEELRDTLQLALNTAGVPDGKVEFWTTGAALKHLKEALGNTRVVGEGKEQMRMRRLIGLEPGDFWQGSRYEGKEGCLRGIRLNIFPEPRDPKISPMCEEGIRSLHLSTASTCRQFLSEYTAVHSDPSLLSSTYGDLPAFLRPDRLPVPKVAELSVPLPIVSLGAMQRGGEEGMTTLCMGNVVWRELFTQGRWRIRGWTHGNWEVEWARRGRGKDNNDKGGEEEDAEADIGEASGNAVIWLMPYRSLGEGKRVRFENGDYSFPVSKSSEA